MCVDVPDAQEKAVNEPFLRQKDLFVGGKDGYHTYRIPALVVSPKGVVLAFCEGRKYSSRDFGDVDIVLRRSFDNGETWEPMQIVADDGPNTMGNPCPIVDKTTGTVWLLFCENNAQVYVMKSNDGGATWSSPLEITSLLERVKWDRFGTGPCHGIQLKNGKLVSPCWRQVGPHMTYSQIVFSKDHGRNWELGGTVGPYMDESTVVQLHNGSLYLNMRNYANIRAYARSENDGLTWSEIEFDKTLVEPVCQGSVLRFTDKDSHDRNRILFSNPASQEREMMTVRLSYDECQSWEVSKNLYPVPSAYSDLAIAPDMTIDCLYERGEKDPYEKITFSNFNVEWLTDCTDHIWAKRAA